MSPQEKFKRVSELTRPTWLCLFETDGSTARGKQIVRRSFGGLTNHCTGLNTTVTHKYSCTATVKQVYYGADGVIGCSGASIRHVCYRGYGRDYEEELREIEGQKYTQPKSKNKLCYCCCWDTYKTCLRLNRRITESPNRLNHWIAESSESLNRQNHQNRHGTYSR